MHRIREIQLCLVFATMICMMVVAGTKYESNSMSVVTVPIAFRTMIACLLRAVRRYSSQLLDQP